MNDVVAWLLQGPPWVEYRTRVDLLDQPEDTPEVKKARQAMLEHPQIQEMITGLAGWSGYSLKRHNDASHMLHKLVFLADLGVQSYDPGMSDVINSVTARRTSEGAFTILANVPRSFGGSGEDEWVWMLCDTPSVLYSLLRMGVEVDRRETAVRHLAGYGRPDGWPCAVSP
jgi:hypothetical protein